MKTLLPLTLFAASVILSGYASPKEGERSDSGDADGTPPEFSEALPHFQFDKASPEAKSVGTLVFRVQKVGSMSAALDPGFLVVLANAVVLSSDCEGLRKGEVFVAEFPEMAAMLDQSMLYPNQIDVGDVITIAVTGIEAKHISGFWRERKRANHSPDPTASAVTPAADAPVAPAIDRGSS